MSVKRTFARGLSGEGVAAVAYNKEVEAGALLVISEAIADGEIDHAVAASIDVAALKALLIGSDQDVTVEVNQAGGGSGDPDQTLQIAANQPLLWLDGDPTDCPVLQDVSVIYVTNQSGAKANFELRAMTDPST